MRLGMSAVPPHENPEDWARQIRAMGMGTAVFPVDYQADESLIDAYRDAAEKYDLIIAEVGSWMCNPASPDKQIREISISYSIGQLKLADRVCARCCVNVAGAAGSGWDRPYKENYSREHWERTVRSIQEIIDRAEPEYTFYTVEPMPWMVPDGPESYEQLLQAVDRERFAVHMDLVNWLNAPGRYFDTAEFARLCFSKLGDKIRSCHIKDALLLEPFTFQIQELPCGQGEVDLSAYLELAEKQDTDMPVLIEHLKSPEAYRESAAYMAEYIRKLGIHLK